MANAVFNSFESYLDRDSYNTTEHTNFDLSHITNFTTTYGAIVPFYLEDCLPTDKFRIKNICKIQALPMSNPVFNNIRFTTWYFYIPYQALWHNFHRFIDGGKNGTFTAELPYIEAKFSKNSLGDYLGFPIISETGAGNNKIKVSAFPFAFYQSMYKHFFFNEDLQTTGDGYNSKALDDWWFPSDDNKFALHDGLNWIMYEDETAGESYAQDLGTGNAQLKQVDNSGAITESMLKSPILSVLRFHNYQKDYFTSAMFSPQRGPAQGVPVESSAEPFTPDFVKSLFDKDYMPTGATKNFNTGRFIALQGGFAQADDSTVNVPYPDDPDNPFKLTTKTYGTDPETLAYTFLSSEISGITDSSANQIAIILNRLANRMNTGAFTITDVMIASQIELWMQRNMQVKSNYSDFMRVHFGINKDYGDNNKPVYIGGTTQFINISEVVQNSESNITPQGTVTGRADSYRSDFVGDFFCPDFGMIMGVCCIMPEIYYTNGLDKKWCKTSRFDFVMPELSQLPPEPIYNYEIYSVDPQSASSKAVFGYTGRHDNYRHRRNMAVGDLRDPNMADFYSWLITREFGSTPTLQDNTFISTNKLYGTMSLPADDTTINIRYDHFPTANTVNPFIVQIGLNISATRPLPFRNEPQTLNLRRG